MDPIGVRFTFEEKKVTIGGYELPDEELVDEESRPVKERILAALRLEGATIKQLVQITDATEGTIRNKLSELRGEGLITDNGRKPATYELLSSSPPGTGEIDDDDNSATTVAELFAKPPEWLATQLGQYHKDPARYLKPVCAAVATEVFLDATRWEEVRAEVERILQEGSQV
jgi:DNA-binding transcriptional ArsR family regulator